MLLYLIPGVKTIKIAETRPHFPELFPLVPEKQAIGALCMEIWAVPRNGGISVRAWCAEGSPVRNE